MLECHSLSSGPESSIPPTNSRNPEQRWMTFHRRDGGYRTLLSRYPGINIQKLLLVETQHDRDRILPKLGQISSLVSNGWLHARIAADVFHHAAYRTAIGSGSEYNFLLIYTRCNIHVLNIIHPLSKGDMILPQNSPRPVARNPLGAWRMRS